MRVIFNIIIILSALLIIFSFSFAFGPYKNRERVKKIMSKKVTWIIICIVIAFPFLWYARNTAILMVIRGDCFTAQHVYIGDHHFISYNDEAYVEFTDNAPNTAWGCIDNKQGGGALDSNFEIATNLNAYLGVNAGDAVITAECKYDGNSYSITYNYYILDFYDWKFADHADLYSLNLYGISNSFLSIGKFSGYATFTDANSEISNFQLEY